MILSHIQWSWDSVLLFTCSIITFAILWRKFSSKARLPPGPRGLPLLGYLPFLDPNLHHGYTKLAQRYGPIFKLKLGSKTHIVISSSELVKVVLREQDEIFANRDPPIAGTVISYGRQNIVWSDHNSLWRNMRKVIAYEVLGNKNLQASSTFRQGGVRKTIKHVYETMGTEVDIGGIAFLTLFNVITSIVWGKSLVEDVKSTNLGVEFREVIAKIVELLGVVNVSDIFPVLSRFDLQGVEREMMQQRKIVDAFFERIIKERIAVKPEEVVEKIERKDFLQILLELKEQKAYTSLNITQIKALLVDIFIGTTDPTSTMVEWTMAELLKNPSIMQKVKDELKEVVGLNNIVQESHLLNLKYLDAVVKETFRLHPPVPLLVVRCPNESCNVAGYTVPKGANVYVNVWAIHRDPQYWDNPLEFNPNRFLSVDDGTTKFDYNGYNPNFIPFGSGRRRCPGVPLGEKMLVYFLASMLHSFDWTLPNGEHELSDKFGIVLKKNRPLMAIASQNASDVASSSGTTISTSNQFDALNDTNTDVDSGCTMEVNEDKSTKTCTASQEPLVSDLKEMESGVAPNTSDSCNPPASSTKRVNPFSKVGDIVVSDSDDEVVADPFDESANLFGGGGQEFEDEYDDYDYDDYAKQVYDLPGNLDAFNTMYGTKLQGPRK